MWGAGEAGEDEADGARGLQGGQAQDGSPYGDGVLLGVQGGGAQEAVVEFVGEALEAVLYDAVGGEDGDVAVFFGLGAEAVTLLEGGFVGEEVDAIQIQGVL